MEDDSEQADKHSNAASLRCDDGNMQPEQQLHGKTSNGVVQNGVGNQDTAVHVQQEVVKKRKAVIHDSDDD